MSDNQLICPYCKGHTKIRKKIKSRIWDGVTLNTKTIYHYYVGCNRCFMRGPLMPSESNAIAAFKHLILHHNPPIVDYDRPLIALSHKLVSDLDPDQRSVLRYILDDVDMIYYAMRLLDDQISKDALEFNFP